MSGLEVLVELQELDTRLSQLDHKSKTLPEFDRLAELEAGDKELQSSFAEIEVGLSVLRNNQNEREIEIQQLEDKIAKATSSLYGGDMTSPKEAALLQSEIDSIAGRQSLLEDQVIDLMEQIEPYATEEERFQSALLRWRTVQSVPLDQSLDPPGETVALLSSQSHFAIKQLL